ncbi:MAG: DUF11 domain-containing protein, partial [Lentisphaeria bacterium]|nr:DUF11 domain-containing protein [Lentisphaeria bacterium]
MIKFPVHTEIIDRIDKEFQKSINVSSANFGDEITWKIVISNNGPSNAYGVK